MTKINLLRSATYFISQNIDLFVRQEVLDWADGKHEEPVKWKEGQPKRRFGIEATPGANGRNYLWLHKEEFDENNKYTAHKCICGHYFCHRKGIDGYKYHIRTCYTCLEKIKEVSFGTFNDLLEYYRSCKRVVNADELLKAYGIRPAGRNVSSIKAQKNSHTDESAQEFLDCSHVATSIDNLPSGRGVYLVRYLNNGKWIPIYCGKSENIKERWKGHHRMPEIQLLSDIGIEIEFRYIVETSFLKLNKDLLDLEKDLIKAFNPKLNQSLTLYEQQKYLDKTV
jgi:hypothetical protein